MTLSKSNYISFLTHPAYLWLKKYDKDKIPPTDEDTQDMFDAGNLFESYVEKLFPNAVRIGFTKGVYNNTYSLMPEKTKEALDAGADTILQGRLEANNITCIFDVLKRVEGNTFDLSEIKSSTSAKPEHLYDLAFQKEVLEGAGLNIRKISVIHCNRDYVRHGEIDIEKLTMETDITEDVKSLKEVTKEQITNAFHILDLKKCPDLSPRYINQLEVPETAWKGDWMKVFLYIKKDIPEYSIYKLCGDTSKVIETLEYTGIEDIRDIPEDMEGLNAKQITQIQATKSGERVINKEEIKKFIKSLEYPLYFFDYETLSSVIPMFDGMGPYKDYPFQYSLHILNSPGANLQHKEYLHKENSNPVPNLIKKMKEDFGDKGTVLAWNMGYEKGCNERMAEMYPKHADFLLSLNERMNDPMIPFSKQWFVDKDFFGSASLKYVLPVLVPEFNYKELDVSEGMQARRVWTQTFLEDKNTWNKDEITKNLIKYCSLDTYAMVRILEELEKI